MNYWLKLLTELVTKSNYKENGNFVKKICNNNWIFIMKKNLNNNKLMKKII